MNLKLPKKVQDEFRKFSKRSKQWTVKQWTVKQIIKHNYLYDEYKTKLTEIVMGRMKDGSVLLKSGEKDVLEILKQVFARSYAKRFLDLSISSIKKPSEEFSKKELNEFSKLSKNSSRWLTEQLKKDAKLYDDYKAKLAEVVMDEILDDDIPYFKIIDNEVLELMGKIFTRAYVGKFLDIMVKDCEKSKGGKK
jgi:hypothetical protein